MMEQPIKKLEKIKLKEINPYLTCHLCKGYLIDATSISECLHSFCRSCIIRYLQENSSCPVCDVIINKAKPNLKLDKTLQDVVYKLVPELFLREMTRRKQYYQQYPDVAARVSPEERGEDTERTIFNPQDCISLSLEYISVDSTPGAIPLLHKKTTSDGKLADVDDAQTLMKRYLQCPGMCRIEVLKKFIRNKYNVDTSLYYIDILYKKVPLPDYYTLIDIAYIYTWRRNEPMKFYFRITDIGQDEPTCNILQSVANVSKTSTKSKILSEKTSKRRERVKQKCAKSNGSIVGKNKAEVNDGVKREANVDVEMINKKIERTKDIERDLDAPETDNSKTEETKTKPDESRSKEDKENCCVNEKPQSPLSRLEPDVTSGSCVVAGTGKSKPASLDESTTFVKTLKPDDERKVKEPIKCTNSEKKIVNTDATNAEITEHKTQVQKSEPKNVYTSITLNRSNNMEIITKIQKVSNKEGQPIGLNIIKQTVQKSAKADSDLIQSNKTQIAPGKVEEQECAGAVSKEEINCVSDSEEEKLKFLRSIELTSRNAMVEREQKQSECPAVPQSSVGHKRKNSSPIKNEKSKRPKTGTTRIILQPKVKNAGLQSIIETCKIPSSLSITIKEGNDAYYLPSLVPPVKNYIEILKLPDDNDKSVSTNAPSKINFNTICDNDSEQKVDQDLSEIAKSLTEKIPMSTTISQIVGPKPQYPIPIKSSTSTKPNIQPSAVPEVPCKVSNDKLVSREPQTFQKIFEESIKKHDSTKPPETETLQKDALDLSESSTAANTNKRSILEIAAKPCKKTKPETKTEESCTSAAPIPKVPIPRFHSHRYVKPNQKQKNLRFDVAEPTKFTQTLANLHSNALGLNYTISIGHNGNGLLQTPRKEDIKTTTVRVIPPSNSPVSKNVSSPKHSTPKSSPMIKHMYAPVPSLLLDQHKVSSYTPKIPVSPKLPLPSPTPPAAARSLTANSSSSPKTTESSPFHSSLSAKPSSPVSSPSTSSSPKPSPSNTSSPKPSGSQNTLLSPNQILEKYNIQNLAQLTASLNFNTANFGLNQTNQLAAFQHAMLLKHFEMQNRQNWLNVNQGSLLQYEKYLQSLKSNQSQLLGNIKEN